MTEWDHNPRGGLKIVAAIGQEFERRTVALGLAGAVVAATAAGAAAGVLPPIGSVIPGGADPEAQREHGSEAQTVVARGGSPVGGPWRLTAFKSTGRVENGVTVESPGDCLQLQLSQPPEGTPVEATLLCGASGDADLKAGSLPVSDSSSGDAELLLFGRAPEAATSIELSTDAGRTVRVEPYEAPSGFAGRTWLMAVPRGPKGGQLDWTDRNGKRAGAKLDASPHLERLASLRK